MAGNDKSTATLAEARGSGELVGPNAMIGEWYAATAHESLDLIAARVRRELLDGQGCSSGLPATVGFDITAHAGQLTAHPALAGLLSINLYSESIDTREDGAALDAAMHRALACASQFNAVDLTHPELARFIVSITAYDHPDGPGHDHPQRVLVATMCGDTADYFRDVDTPVQPLPVPLSTGPGTVLAG
jgi:hypothetical protein